MIFINNMSNKFCQITLRIKRFIHKRKVFFLPRGVEKNVQSSECRRLSLTLSPILTTVWPTPGSRHALGLRRTISQPTLMLIAHAVSFSEHANWQPCRRNWKRYRCRRPGREIVMWTVNAVNGPITIAIRARFEYDSTTIRLQHATRCVRFEYDTTSYEELCAFEQ